MAKRALGFKDSPQLKEIIDMESKLHSTDQKVDRLSHLPDPIRRHIVSFLPMQDAMRTSILSKQWRRISYCLSNLEFDQYEFGPEANKIGTFRDFVEETLLLHDESNIQRFSLKYKDNSHELVRPVHAWISFALRHKVQNLDLGVYLREEPVKFPCYLPTCSYSSLTVLTIYNIFLRLPTVIKFPTLTHLALEEVQFHGEDSLNELFLSNTFPVLKDLLILNIHLDHIQTLSISIHSLEFLRIYYLKELNINLVAPTLKSIGCSSYDPPNISSTTLSSLVDAEFDMFGFESYLNDPTKNSYNPASNILAATRNVKSLLLMKGFTEFLTKDKDLVNVLPISCRSLKNLAVEIFPTENYIKVVTCLVRSYPSLQILILHVWGLEEAWPSLNMMNMNDYWQSREVPTEELMDQLRIVVISNFRGTNWELFLVKMVLLLARNLEVMDIRTCQDIRRNATARLNMREIVLTIPKVSRASVSFS